MHPVGLVVDADQLDGSRNHDAGENADGVREANEDPWKDAREAMRVYEGT